MKRREDPHRRLIKMKILMLSLIFTQLLQGAESPKKNAPKYKKNVQMEFEGRSVDGNVVSPDSADVEGEKNIKFDPLLEGRKDFKREFKRSSGVNK